MHVKAVPRAGLSLHRNNTVTQMNQLSNWVCAVSGSYKINTCIVKVSTLVWAPWGLHETLGVLCGGKNMYGLDPCNVWNAWQKKESWVSDFLFTYLGYIRVANLLSALLQRSHPILTLLGKHQPNLPSLLNQGRPQVQSTWRNITGVKCTTQRKFHASVPLALTS